MYTVLKEIRNIINSYGENNGFFDRKDNNKMEKGREEIKKIIVCVCVCVCVCLHKE